MKLIAGIFVGGRATRMGGVAKGLLLAPDGEPIVVRTRRLLEDAGATCVLVGRHPAYADLGLETLPDDPEADGPLAGLLALLERAHPMDAHAIAVACDMPLLERGLLGRLIHAPSAGIVAPRRAFWEPFFARYEPSVLAVARAYARSGGKKLQLLFEQAGARALALTAEEDATLVDWDLPADALRDTTRA